MTIEQAWLTLGMSATMDESAVKAQYRKQLPSHNPEDDPEGFKALREAYEAAIAYIKKGGDAPKASTEEGPKDEVDLWLDQIKELYKYMDMRSDPKVWKEKLDDPVCIGLDTTYAAREKLLIFLMDHHYLPPQIWAMIDHTFRLREEKADLLEKFPADYINYVIYQTTNEDVGPYQYFSYRGVDEAEAAYDQYLDQFYSLNAAIMDLTEQVDAARLPNRNDEEMTGNLEIKSRKEVLEENEDFRKKAESLYEDLNKLTLLEIYNPYEDLFRLNIALLVEADHVTLRDRDASYEEVAEKLADQYSIPLVLRICGEAYVVAGDWEKAKALWEKGLELKPDHRMLKFEMSRYHFHLGEFKEAENILREIIALVRSSYTVQVYYYQLNQAMHDHYQELIQADPEDMDTYMEYCWSLFDTRRIKETLEALDARTYQEGTSAYYDYADMKGRCYIFFQQYEEAYPWVLAWEKAWEGLTDDGTDRYNRRKKSIHYLRFTKADCLYHMAISRPDASLYDEAKDLLLQSIEGDDDESLLYTYYDLLERVYTRSGHYKECVDIADSQLKDNPEYIPAVLRRQDAFYHMRNYQEVINDYRRIVSAYPAYYRTYCLVLRIFIGYNQLSEAETVLKEAEKNGVTEPALKMEELDYLRRLEKSDEVLETIEKKAQALLEQLKTAQFDPYIPSEDFVKPTDVWFILACAYTEYDKPEMAFDILKEHEPTPPEKRFRMLQGNVLRMQNRFKEALAIYKKMLSPNDRDAKLYYYIGLCQMELNDTRSALASFLTSVEIDPEYDYAIYQLACLYKNRYLDYRSTFDYEKSKEFFNRLVKLNPSVFVLNARAELLRLRKDLPLAIQDLENAFRLDPEGKEDDFICYRLGDLYFLNRDTQRAEDMFYKAIELFGSRQSAPIWQIADICGSRGEWKKGAEFLVKYNEGRETNLDHQKKIAEFYTCAGMEAEAKNIYDKMLSNKLITQPDYYWLLFRLGLNCHPENFKAIYMNLNSHLLKCLGIGNAFVHWRYRHKKDFNLSMLSPFDKSRFENMAEYYHKLGSYYLYARELKTARKYLEYARQYHQLLKQDTHLHNYRALAITCFLSGDQAKAKEYAEKYIRLQITDMSRPPDVAAKNGCNMNTEEYYLNSMECDNALNYNHFGLMHLCMGEKDVCEKYLELNERCALCLSCRYQVCYDALITKAYLAESNGDKEAAAGYFRDAAAICPHDEECTMAAYYVNK